MTRIASPALVALRARYSAAREEIKANNKYAPGQENRPLTNEEANRLIRANASISEHGDREDEIKALVEAAEFLADLVETFRRDFQPGWEA